MDRTRLLAARLRAAGHRPYLATALYALTVVPSTDVPTMAVDPHWRCYVNPAFVDATPVEELAAVWIHEVAHLLRDHHGRYERLDTAQQRGHELANIAQDCEINDDLVADGLPLPAGSITPDLFRLPKGLLFEDYLRRLPPLTKITCSCECGSGAHGRRMPWDLDTPDAPSLSPVEAESIRRQTAEAVRQHERNRGTVPAGWKRWAEQILEPTVDWRRVLTGAVREACAWAMGALDYHYNRPARRSAALRGVVLPGLRRPLPRVAVIVDTSGSMNDDDLTAALTEIAGVLRAVGVGGNRVSVLSCDADVHTAREVHTLGQVELLGGGGTDMRVGIDAALTGPQSPNVVIVLTDGHTPWPEHPPTARLVAGLIGDNPPQPPAWIETVHITP
ncbi:VWA-like domain-containing protein [Streptomyces sp. NPDC018693]|uniref:vWA domain-containing protein n=1 Tax=unclassified Streptomyces TaxID=2593676 RepID=UPI0037B07B5E